MNEIPEPVLNAARENVNAVVTAWVGCRDDVEEMAETVSALGLTGSDEEQAALLVGGRTVSVIIDMLGQALDKDPAVLWQVYLARQRENRAG